MQRWLRGSWIAIFSGLSVESVGLSSTQPQWRGHARDGLTKGVTADDVSRCDSTASHYESEAHAEATQNVKAMCIMSEMAGHGLP